jgi:hypothetical protein
MDSQGEAQRTLFMSRAAKLVIATGVVCLILAMGIR